MFDKKKSEEEERKRMEKEIFEKEMKAKFEKEAEEKKKEIEAEKEKLANMQKGIEDQKRMIEEKLNQIDQQGTANAGQIEKEKSKFEKYQENSKQRYHGTGLDPTKNLSERDFDFEEDDE